MIEPLLEDWYEGNAPHERPSSVVEGFAALRVLVGDVFDRIGMDEFTHDMRHDVGEHDACRWCVSERSGFTEPRP